MEMFYLLIINLRNKGIYDREQERTSRYDDRIIKPNQRLL
jgi:hypothetical protein